MEPVLFGLKQKIDNIYFLDREREREGGRVCMSRGGAEREGDTESEGAVSTEPDAGLELTNHEIMT